MSSRTTRAALGIALVAVLGSAGVAAVALQDDRRTPGASARPSASASPAALVRGALLPAPEAAAPVPLQAQLGRAVAGALENPALAGGLAVSIVDAQSGDVLYERAAATPLLPASTAKIATAVATLVAVPPETRLVTRVLAGATPGEVVLVGGGDPTLAGPKATPEYPAPARLTDLAKRVRAGLGPTPVTTVLVDEALYSGARLGPGWKPDYFAQGSVAPVGPLMVDAGKARPDRSRRVDDPAVAAGEALAALLQPGADVTVSRGRAPAGAAELAQVESEPVARLVERMLTRSDNDLAEALARQVALAQGQPASFAGASSAVRTVLAGLLDDVGVGADAVALQDGSGLSRADRLQPAALTRLLAGAASGDDPRLAPLLTGLPVAGFDGTLAKRYRGGPALPGAGSVRAKTGTLDGVSALAGLVRTADGRLLAFDLTATDVAPGIRGRAEDALDALAATLASCGCS